MLFLLACAPTTTACPTDFFVGNDGLCYGSETTTAGASVDDLLASLPACTTPDGDGRIDLASGCVDGGCAGDSYEAMNAAFGEEGAVGGYVGQTGGSSWFAFVDWSNGVSSMYPVTENAEAPAGYMIDAGAATPWQLSLASTFPGSTTDGLGPSSELSCWIDRLGYPDSLSYSHPEDGSQSGYATWDNPHVNVYSYPDTGPPFAMNLWGAIPW